MQIKNKSKLLIILFLSVLVINTIGIFYSLNKIKAANNHLIEESNNVKIFQELKFTLKNLQEISTDTALIGDNAGLKEIKKVEKQYHQINSMIMGKSINIDNRKNLELIHQHFEEYSKALYKMAEFGIQNVMAKQNSKNTMKEFDLAVEKLEKDVEGMVFLNKYQLLEFKYNIVSIQEILTDALAVGDLSGLADVDVIYNNLAKQISTVQLNQPLYKNDLMVLKKNLEVMISLGKSMAKYGSIINETTDNISTQMELIDRHFDTIDASINNIVENENSLMNDSIEYDKLVISTFEIVSLILTIIFAIAVIALFFILKNILTNILKLDNAMIGLTQNTITEVDIQSNDEIGNISNNFNQYIKKIEQGVQQDIKVIDEASVVIGKVNAGLFNDRIRQQANSPEIKKLIDVINSMIDTTQYKLTELSKVLDTLANAKFDVTINRVEGTTGLVASLFHGMQVTQSTMNEVMALMDNSTKRLTFGASDLSDAAQELSNSSNQQAAALEQTAAAIEEVTSTIVHSTENTIKMSQYAKNVTKSSEKGILLANQTSTSMDELSTEINTINDAIKIIDQIAFQTNILSLNAAVEAATAGEAGKGFAVVAQEVRNLASRSAEAANQIKQLVESAKNKANDGKNVAFMMIEGFNELNNDITSTIAIIDDVANATKEQQEAMNQINNTVNSLDQATQKNASLSSQISDMALVTKDLAVQLQGAVDKTTFSQEAKRRVCDTSMIFDLNKLKSDHINLKNTNFCMCKVGDKVNVKKHTECDMGKWIIASENKEFAQTKLWDDLKSAHKRYHGMIQDTVDLYKDNYANGQIFSVTENLEQQIDKIFTSLDKLKEHNCNLQFEKRK
ncbi:MAG: methyl-accepting chemotaxis protein [Arcobacteraceae bacterium]